MGSEERKPSLEAPSLGFRRRRKAPPASGAEQPIEPASPAPGSGLEDSTQPATPPDDQPSAPGSRLEDSTQPATPPDDQPSAPGSRLEDSTQPAASPVEQAPGAERARKPRQPLNGHLAAAVAGLVVGTFLVSATFGGLQGCESLRGTTSCGGGPGSLLLLLIVVLAVVVGAWVLRAAGTPSAGSISFLAVALVAVLSVLFLLDSVDDVAGAVAVGALTIGAYVLSHWVTVRYIDTAD